MSRRRHLATPVAALLAAVTLAGCGSSTPTPSASPSTSTPAATPTPECWRSPLTGGCSEPSAPVLVVKVDDVSEARPQFHLNQADLVLVEPVEGGLTRLFVVFNSSLPPVVGPIRSARITDTDLTPAFGDPLFAYSGSQSKLVPYLQRARMQLIGAPQGGTGYRRLSDRRAPHNYVADVPELLTRVDDTTTARLASASYWTISDEPVETGTVVAKVTVRWPAAEKSYVWDTANSRWNMDVYGRKLMTQVDEQGTTERVHASNVVIMRSELLASEFGDKFGGRTPYPQTVGTGSGWVLVDGRMLEATWQRPSEQDLPRWFDLDGREIALRPGNTWWLVTTARDSVRAVLPKAAVDTATASAGATMQAKP